MTSDEMTELIALYVDNVLPQALRGHVEALLASDPQAAEEAETLKSTRAQLAKASSEAPDPWFTERVLDRLLRENATAQTVDTAASG